MKHISVKDVDNGIWTVSKLRELNEPVEIELEVKDGPGVSHIETRVVDFNDIIRKCTHAIDKFLKSGNRKIIGKMFTKIVWTLECTTACTDGVRILFNPIFANDLVSIAGKNYAQKVKEQKLKYDYGSFEIFKLFLFVITHEVYHMLYRHIERANAKEETKNGANHILANCSADIEINRDIEIQWPEFKGATIESGGIYEADKYVEELWEPIFDDKYKKGEQPDIEDPIIPPPPQGGGGGGPVPPPPPGPQKEYKAPESYKKGWEKALEDIASGKVTPDNFSPLPVDPRNFDHHVLAYSVHETVMSSINIDEYNQGYNDCIQRWILGQNGGEGGGGGGTTFTNLKPPPTPPGKGEQEGQGGQGGQGEPNDKQGPQGKPGEDGEDGDGEDKNGKNGKPGEDGEGKSGKKGKPGEDGEGKSGKDGENGEGQNNSNASEINKKDKAIKLTISKKWGGSDIIHKETAMKIAEHEGEDYKPIETNKSSEDYARKLIRDNIDEIRQIGSRTAAPMSTKLKNIAQILQRPVANWKNVLRNHLNRAGRRSTSLKMDRRRFASGRLDAAVPIRPYHQFNQNAADVFYLVDISGSVSVRDLMRVFSEIAGPKGIEHSNGLTILKSALAYFAERVVEKNIRTWTFADSPTSVLKRIEPTDKDKLCGGGTNIQGSILQIMKLPSKLYSKSSPQTILLVFTDGEDASFRAIKNLKPDIRKDIIFCIMNSKRNLEYICNKLITEGGILSGNIVAIDTTSL